MSLTAERKQELTRLIEAGEALPEIRRQRLFPRCARESEIGKEYRLVYEGKARREEVLAQTPAAPWHARAHVLLSVSVVDACVVTGKAGTGRDVRDRAKR